MLIRLFIIPIFMLFSKNLPSPNNASAPLSSRTGEILFDTNVIYVPVSAVHPSVSWNGSNYLVAWYSIWAGTRDIYGARVTSGGFLLDSGSIYISLAPNNQRDPSVATDGSNFFVVWSDDRNGEMAIYGTRIDAQGAVIDSTGILISTGAVYHPCVTFYNMNYFVVWSKQVSYYDWHIYCARVNTDGVVIDTTGIAISPTPGRQDYPSIAFDGVNYLVVWEDNRNGAWDIYGARVSPDGTVLDSTGFAISAASNGQEHPVVAFDGTNYFVVWQDNRLSGWWDIFGARVSPDGVVLDTAGLVISDAPRNQIFPSLAFDGANYLVAWGDSRYGVSDINGALVNHMGSVISSIAISTANDGQTYPSVCFDGMNYFVVWVDKRYSYTQTLYGARVSSTGVVLDPLGIPVSWGVYRQESPATAFDGTNFFTVWQDNRNVTSYDIYGTRISSTGEVLDPLCIPISTAPGNQINPAIAYGGGNYFVVWVDFRNGRSDIYGARVNQAGVVLDPSGIFISDNAQNPAVAFGGQFYLVAWDAGENIYCSRISLDGVVLDTLEIPVSIDWRFEYEPAIAFDTTNYFVVWWSFYYGDLNYRNEKNFILSENRQTIVGQVWGARVSQSGVVLDPEHIFLGGGWEYVCSSPSVAFDDYNYLVTWDMGNMFDNTNGIYGTRVAPTGVVLDPSGIPICVAPEDQHYPCVAFGSSGHFIAWQDYRDGEWNIYGARVSRAGNIMETFSVSLQPDQQIQPSIADGIGDTILITYSGFTDSINNTPANTMRIWGKFYPFTGIGEKPVNRIMESDYDLVVFPNPFRDALTIKMINPKTTSQFHDSIVIYDVTGRVVRSFARVSNICWYGDDNTGRKLPAGIYFVYCEGKLNKSVKIVKIE